MGIEVKRGDPRENKPGERIVLPEHPSQIKVRDIDLDQLRRSYLRNAIGALPQEARVSEVDLEFLAAETRMNRTYVQEVIDEMRRES